MRKAEQGHRLKSKLPRFGFIPTLTATMLAVFCLPTQAGFKLEVDAGFEYDSNVATDAAETDAGIGDFSRNLKLGLGYDHQLNKRWNLSGLYRLSDTRWQTYSEFDNQMHIGVARLGHQLGKLSSDLSLIHAYGSVDGMDFLSLSRISPAFGYLINPKWFIRAQSDFSHKTFDQYKQRNGNAFAASLYLYHFIDRTRLYISAQAQWKDENANDEVYAYQANTLKLQLKRDGTWWGYKFTSRIKGHYEKRQYVGYRRVINAARADERWRLGLETSVKLTEHWQLSGSVQTDWFDSNVAAANYDQERFQLGFSWEF